MHSGNGIASEQRDDVRAALSTGLDLDKPNILSTTAIVGKAEPGTYASAHPCTYRLKHRMLHCLT